MFLASLRNSPEWSQSSPGWPVSIPPLRWVLLTAFVAWSVFVLWSVFMIYGVPAPLAVVVAWVMRLASALWVAVAGLGG